MSSIDLQDPAFVSVYDDLPLWSAPCGLLLLDTVSLRPGMRALDIGCGTGFPLVELAERLGPASEVHGIDPWRPAVERAREKIARRGVPQAQVHEGSAEALPFSSAHFDLVVSNLGVNNFERPGQVLAECRRVVRPGGELALSTNLEGTMAELYQAYEEALAGLGFGDASERVARLVGARSTLDGLRTLLLDAGFETVRVAESSFRLRFADARAIFTHSFVRLAFLGGWRSAVDPADADRVFEALRHRLDVGAGAVLTVPVACIVARAT